ncbi:MAG: bifunctional serine/threonine-protein kinase/formylglycine-generating enzyme family protein [Nannocystaceae bacterium]
MPTPSTFEEVLEVADVAAPTVAVVGPPPSSTALLARGAAIGRYLVLDHLGTGGMGVVYSAYDPELDRKVAVKLLKHGVGDYAGRARLLREAQAMAKLAHPNVVTVYDVGTVDEQVFVAMELIQGVTLSRAIWSKRRTWQEILDLFLAAGRGLAAAHRAGLTHRDLKPDNVMVGDDGRARVMDFGLARVGAPDLGGEGEAQGGGASAILGDLALTRTGAVLGTPMYMAPEQWTGDPVDARTDQFAFCVALWEALYGERPFRGATLPALKHSVTTGEITPPNDPSRAPVWLRRILERGLQVEPARRFPAMPELLAELSRSGRTVAWRWALAVGVAAAASAGAMALAPQITWRVPDALEPRTPVGEQLIARVVDAADDAGARGHWVFGTVDDPLDTAFYRISVLEDMSESLADPAGRAASALRARYFGVLAELGDSYWARPGGRDFAGDFYAQACVFAHDRAGELVVADVGRAELALGRSRLDPSALDRLVAAAERGTFSPDEIETAEALAVLATPGERAAADEPPPELPPCPRGMALIPGGSLGGRGIPDLCFDVHEVTAAAYQRCIDRGVCSTTDTADGRPHCNLGHRDRRLHPINCVNWTQARTYCGSVGKRLPSEWEWEWAARGRDEARSRPWGAAPASCGVAVMKSGGDGCGVDHTARVGSRPQGASRDGLRDMVGNVWEWTTSTQGDRRILRGGGWLDAYDENLRVQARTAFLSTDRNLGFGFRCVRGPRARASRE